MTELNRTSAGFTLIELLVVIAIIGILSSVVLASLSTARTKAQYAAVKVDMQHIANDIMLAQEESSKKLGQITGSYCSSCAGSCRTGGDLRNVPTSNSCYAMWVNDTTKIQTASDGYVTKLTSILRDPWGSPFLLDENEGESAGNPCRQDTLRSVGADGVWGTSDDYIILLPFESSQCL